MSFPDNVGFHFVQPNLRTLQRHDVVVETQGRWRIIVELFRRWLIQEF